VTRGEQRLSAYTLSRCGSPGRRARPVRRRGKARVRPSIPRHTFIFRASCGTVAQAGSGGGRSNMTSSCDGGAATGRHGTRRSDGWPGAAPPNAEWNRRPIDGAVERALGRVASSALGRNPHRTGIPRRSFSSTGRGRSMDERRRAVPPHGLGRNVGLTQRLSEILCGSGLARPLVPGVPRARPSADAPGAKEPLSREFRATTPATGSRA
jgi:hypothetical protein